MRERGRGGTEKSEKGEGRGGGWALTRSWFRFGVGFDCWNDDLIVRLLRVSRRGRLLLRLLLEAITITS